MGRCPESECLQEESELLVRLLGIDPHHREDPFLDVTAVDADRTAADLVAVADDVVGIGQHRTRIGVDRPLLTRLGRGESVVHRRPGSRADSDVTGGGGLARGFEQRRVDDPDEGPGIGVDQVQAPGDLDPGRAQQRPGSLDRSGREEHAVPRLCPDMGGEAGAFGVGKILGNRAAQFAVLADQHVGQSLGPTLLRPLLPAVQGAPRLGCPAGHHHRTDVGSLEHPERGVLEVVGALHEIESEPQVGLV